jgi:hypothetical protein
VKGVLVAQLVVEGLMRCCCSVLILCSLLNQERKQSKTRQCPIVVVSVELCCPD